MSKQKKPTRSRASQKRLEQQQNNPIFLANTDLSAEDNASDGGQAFDGRQENLELPADFDMRQMERMFAQVSSSLPGSSHNETQREAQELIYEAFDTQDIDEKMGLVTKALTIDEDCADGWNLLAEYSDSPKQQLELHGRAEEAAMRSLGDDFEEFDGQFWGFHETRPFMRALEGQAQALTALGRHEEAIVIYLRMLTHNPNDNQGVRWPMLGLLLQLNKDKVASSLIDQFPDESFILWPLARILLALRSNASEAQLTKLLQDAYSVNPHFVEYLTSKKDLPIEQPSRFIMGDYSEVISALPLILPAWKSTSGAVSWMRKAVAQAGFDTSSDTAISTGSASTADAKRLRKRMEAEAKGTKQDLDLIWQVDYRKTKIGDEAMWNVVVVCEQQKDIVGQLPFDRCPKAADIWDAILLTIVEPENAIANRPSKIEFSKKTLAKSLSKRLDKIGIQSSVAPLEMMESVFTMLESMSKADHLEDSLDPAAVNVVPEMVWQVGVLRLPAAIEEEGEMLTPSAILVIDTQTGGVLASELQTEDVRPEDIAAAIRKAVFSNPIGTTLKPELIHVNSNDLVIDLRPLVDAWGIRCTVTSDMGTFDEVCAGLSQHFAPPTQPFVSEVEGVSAEDHLAFYQAAAGYFQAAPWNKTPSDAAYRISGDNLDFDVYVVPMGHMGSVLGLAVYSSLTLIKSLLAGNPQADFNNSSPFESQEGRVWSVMFNESHEVSPRETGAIETLGLPVTGPEAFPSLLEVIDGEPQPVPGPQVVRLMATCLNAMSTATYPITDKRSVTVGDTALTVDPVVATDV